MLFLILENLFWIGLGSLVLTYLVSRPLLKPNKYKPSIAANVNRAYIVCFFISIYGWSIFTMDIGINGSWYETVGYVIIGIMTSGAWLEGRRDFPLVNRTLLNELSELKVNNEQGYLEFYLSVEELGLEKAFQLHQKQFSDNVPQHPQMIEGEFEIMHAKQAVAFAQSQTFQGVLNSSLPQAYKAIAFQFLAEKELKVAADGVKLDAMLGNDAFRSFDNFFIELGPEEQYEIYPLISENTECIKFYYDGKHDLRQKVVGALTKKLGPQRVAALEKQYKLSYPNYQQVPVAHYLTT